MKKGTAQKVVNLITECEEFFKNIIKIANHCNDIDFGYLLSDQLDELSGSISDELLNDLQIELNELANECETYGVSLHSISCSMAEKLCPELS